MQAINTLLSVYEHELNELRRELSLLNNSQTLLVTQVGNLQTQIANLKERLQQEEEKNILERRIIRNLSTYSSNLKNHERKSLYKMLMIGCCSSDRVFFQNTFNISSRTWYSYNNSIPYQPTTKTKPKLDELIAIVNDQLPVASGRDY